MDKNQIFEEVRSIICSELDVDKEKVTIDASLESDLGADSLDAVEVIMALEDKFSIQLPDEVAMDLKTVSDIVDYIASQQK